jgi:hypothetical protein
MLSFLRRWRPRHLVLSWIAYWIGLAVVTLTPAALAIWRATQAPPGQGNVTFGVGSNGFELAAMLNGSTIWHGSIHLLPLAALIAGPPLLIFIAWLTQQRSPVRAESTAAWPDR